jgi:Putative phage tail protein
MGQYSFKSQSSQKPTAAGSLLQQSAYGQTIPNGFGMTQSPLLPIWAANLRQGGSIKKFKQFKKGITSYVENIDFLLGHNPIRGVLQVMVNGGNYPLNFVSAVFDSGPWTIVDPNFYFVVAVTMEASYSFDVNDYGGQGPTTLSGTWQIPLWNELETGPDPTMPSSYRNYPYCYRWEPSYGPTVAIDTQALASPGPVTIWYAQLKDATSFQAPIAKLRMTFEPQLGSGSEYADAPSPFDDQQIIYPQFAGLGSSEIDLGASGALPQLLPEVAFKWGNYPSGDADFADMIEDIFKSGLAQAALQAEATPVYTQMERGLSSYDLPGVIQYTLNSNGELFDPPLVVDLPTTAGNFLVVIAHGDATTISDTAGNTWTPVFGTGLGFQVWYATAVGGPTVVTVPDLSFGWQLAFLEIAGVDTFDAVTATLNSNSASVTSTNAPGFPAYLLAISAYPGNLPSVRLVPQWDDLGPTNFYQFALGAGPGQDPSLGAQERIVRSPGTYSINLPGVTPSGLCVFSFKAVQPVTYPKPLGDFIDFPSLDLVRAQCRANGLWGSLSMNSQSAASDWLKTLYAAANAAPVFLGSKLFSYPYSEVSTAANGCSYTAPTASGPIANLSDLNGDFVGDDGMPCLTTVDRIALPNILQMQCVDRNTNYNQVTVQQPEAASIALYGERKGDAVVNNAIQDPSIARQLLGIQVRRNQYGGDSWDFTASARWSLLSPMDLITLTDTLQGVFGVPVRIKSYSEQKDGSFNGSAEPFVYGMCAPSPLPVTSPVVNPNTIGTTAGDVNPPVIFEPVPGLYPTQTGDQIWVVVSSPAENYGGCQVFISTDGGSSFTPAPGLSSPPANVVMGSAVTGATVNDWPAASDPDSTNNLELDLTESNGVLASYPTTAENNFEYPCYVEAGTFGLAVDGTTVADSVPLEIEVAATPVADLGTIEVNTTAVAEAGAPAFDYELMTYAVATLTATSKYTLMATGSGNFLRRAVYDAPDSGEGVDHAIGSRFAFLSPAGTGILKMAMPLQYIGQELFFKIISFNQFGGALQSLADVPAYSYTPTGIPGAV